MNTKHVKSYAPKARNQFKKAVEQRLNLFGIFAPDKPAKGTKAEDALKAKVSEATKQGSVLEIGSNTFDAKLAPQRERLAKRAQDVGFEVLLENVAYTWFNRFSAIRFMELRVGYLEHGLRVLSHPTKEHGFEILDHAIEAADNLGLNRQHIEELKLAGDQDEALYRELLLGQCHKLHEAMPFLFDALDDETELLLPDNLTRTDSILRGLVYGIPEEDWQQVEVIGWLYQFYISEKKDQVMGKVVKSEDIPAATQLFTPNWIVKYLVQNSVGRQWLQTYPDSAIKTQMEYYIEPAEQSDEVNQQLKAITPESIEPETIKVLDPACGSGHILIEAYNVLKAIYEERGFRSRDIPKMILENNLYGLDIDDRAAQLSGFALMMMARDDDKRIFTRNVQLNVLSLQESNHIDLPTLWKALNLSRSWQSGTSQGLFSDDDQDLSSFNADNRYQLLKRTLARFTQAKTFGSLIDVPSDDHEQLKELLSTLVELQESGDSMQKPAAKQLIEFVHQGLVLSIRYDAVIANPPYMGSKGMNSELKVFAKKNYPDSKSDLFAIFMERAFSLIHKLGFNAQINMQSWMFLSSYQQLRSKLLEDRTIITMAHLGARAFSQISGEVVQTTAWIIKSNYINNYQPTFYRLVDGNEIDKRDALGSRDNEFSSTAQSDFSKIPGSPIAYWASDKIRDCFQSMPLLSEKFSAKQGLATTNNDLFTRRWYEVSIDGISFSSTSRYDSKLSKKRWFPLDKGGSFRKWYGNNEFVVDWENDGQRIKDSINEKYPYLNGNPDFVAKNSNEYFKSGVTWGKITGGSFSSRFSPEGAVFSDAGMKVVCAGRDAFYIQGLLSSKVFPYFLSNLSETLNYEAGNIGRVPLGEVPFSNMWEEIIKESKNDWDLSEVSWGFTKNSLVKHVGDSLSKSYEYYRKTCESTVVNVKALEEDNNRIFIDSYGLTNELDEKVDLQDVTLNANPVYRYNNAIDSEVKFRSDIISELISYAIGCSLGRYSLDREGIVFAHSNHNKFSELYTDRAFETFPVDEDGIIPLTDQEWFKDDVTNRFREFVQVVWGEEHLQENLDFVAESLCLNAIKSKKSESALETIRRYLSTQFYKDHLKTYKKRPIYWLFSSGKQKAFECLVYLHRYNEGTLSRMRTEYVTPLLGKYLSHIQHIDDQIVSGTAAEKTKLGKELKNYQSKLNELREFDSKLKHYADMRISFDLDDGVKVNYGKFGDLLANVKDITGEKPS